MALHELATNAVKYGAWSTPEGRVEIRWRVDPGDAGDRLHLEWRERGGPPVVPPKRRGFGSRLIERGLAAELGGEVRMRFDPEGLVCVVDAPLTLESEG
jgi:two-component sensor histidine kinase